MSDWAIQVRGLHKQFPGRDGPVLAVDGLDLDVRRGECFGLLGPNGAGKTTTVEIMEGLTAPTSGSVEILGLRWDRDEVAIREKIGVTLQETRFPEKSTVREMARLFRSFYREGLDPLVVLERVALESKAEAFIETLSGGQKQRLAVAIALVGDPELLFLDEPTTGLDPQSRRQLWDVIRNLQERGRTTLLTTHYMDEAERLCDRVAIVDQGKVIALGPPSELISRIGGEHVVEFAVGEGRRDESTPRRSPTCRPSSASRARGRRVRPDGRRAPPRDPGACSTDLAEQSRPLARLTTRQVSLEDVFVSLTGRHLRDNEENGRGRPGEGVAQGPAAEAEFDASPETKKQPGNPGIGARELPRGKGRIRARTCGSRRRESARRRES